MLDPKCGYFTKTQGQREITTDACWFGMQDISEIEREVKTKTNGTKTGGFLGPEVTDEEGLTSAGSFKWWWWWWWGRSGSLAQNLRG